MQLDPVSVSNVFDRVQDWKKKIVKHPHEICIERAKLFTESYKLNKDDPSIIKFAKAMDHYLTNTSIKIWDDECIVGNRTTKYVGTPLFPEVPWIPNRE